MAIPCVDPNDIDARYVHFFHEKIPSRYVTQGCYINDLLMLIPRSTSQLAESTTTQQLDQLIAAQPQRLEFYRTRGIVHCFRDEFSFATKDFTHAIRESRAVRKANFAHLNTNLSSEQRSRGSKKKKGKSGGTKTNGQAPSNGTSPPPPDGPTIDGPDGEPLLLHPSVLPDYPDPIELQCLFLRGAAYLQHAVYLIEEAILKLEEVKKVQSVDGAELRLCYIENGKYGGTEIGNPEGPLGSREGAKLKAYRQALTSDPFKDQINSLIKKALRDHLKFLEHFDTLEGTHPDHEERNLAQKVELAFHLCENLRPNSQYPPPPIPTLPVMFTTYHPLLVESHFSVLICLLMLGEFTTLAKTFPRTALLVDALEGYPVFLPPRSMAQAEFVEVLERLAGGWKNGVQPHSLSHLGTSRESGNSAKGRLLIDISPMASAKAKEVDRAGTPPTPSSTLSSDDCSSLTLSGASAGNSSTAFLVVGVNGSSSSGSRSGPFAQSQVQSPLAISSIPSSSSGRNTPSSVGDVVSTPTRTSTPSHSSNNTSFISTNNFGSSASMSTALTTPSIYSNKRRGELVEALDYARMLLVPVVARQKERAEKAALDRAVANGKKKQAQISASSSSTSSPKSNPATTSSGSGSPNLGGSTGTGSGTKNGGGEKKKKPLSINIPLHGPRVEILLAWLAGVHLTELDSVA